MKKFFCARFALEFIIEEGASAPDVELRDVNGTLCVRGGVSVVPDFLTEVYKQYSLSKSEIFKKPNN